METTPRSEPVRMTKDELDALPIGSVVMTITDPDTFGVYEQRVWQKFGGSRDWQFGNRRHEWQSTDGGFVRVGEQHGTGFASTRSVVVLYVPDESVTAAIESAHRNYRAIAQERGGYV